MESIDSGVIINNAWVYRQNICTEVMESIHSGVLVNNAWVYRQNSCTEVIKSIDSSVIVNNAWVYRQNICAMNSDSDSSLKSLSVEESFSSSPAALAFAFLP